MTFVRVDTATVTALLLEENQGIELFPSHRSYRLDTRESRWNMLCIGALLSVVAGRRRTCRYP